ncbi:MAG: YceI family protein [Chloroflexota bacterium]
MKRSYPLKLVITLLLLMLSACAFAEAPETINPPVMTPTGSSSSASQVEEALTNTPTAISQDEPSEVEDAEQTQSIATAELGLGVVAYQIVPTESTARFELDEDLRSALTTWHQGSRITVVGITDQLFGDFTLDFSNLTASQFNEMRIDAHTLKTDDFWRTRAVQNEILETETYPFVTFSPSQTEGLAESITVGESVTFNILGDLTIRDISLPQTLTVSATLQADMAIIANVNTAVNREDYNLIIPGVPHVDNVEEEVELYIDFVARQAQE